MSPIKCNGRLIITEGQPTTMKDCLEKVNDDLKIVKAVLFVTSQSYIIEHAALAKQFMLPHQTFDVVADPRGFLHAPTTLASIRRALYHHQKNP